MPDVPIPPKVAREWHVATTGDDSSAGHPQSPVRTISEAARRALPGDAILIHPGIYRERVDPPRGGSSDSCRITYRAVETGKADLRGSEVVSGWDRQEGDVWRVRIPNIFFEDFNPFSEILRGHWFLDKGRKHHRGAVYLHGHWLAEAASLEALGTEHEGDRLWFAEVDDIATTIRAEFPGVDPNAECVEINVRPTVFYPSREGCNFISVHGLVLQHAATPWSPPTTEQIGIVGTNWSKGWVIEDNLVRYAIAAGITLGKYHDPLDFPELDTVEGTLGEDTYHGTIRRALEHGWSLDTVGNHTVRNNEVSHCEMAGICGSLGAVRSVIEGNTVHHIHVRRLFSGFEQAGIKFHAPIDSVIRGNRIFDCVSGLWLDWMTQGTRVSGNLFYNNGVGHDLFIEVSHGPFVVDNNLFLSKRSLSSWSEGGLYAHNLFAGSVDLYAELTRVTPFHCAHSTEILDWKNVSIGNDLFLNNVFADPNGMSDYDASTEPVRFEGNLFLGESTPSTHDTTATRNVRVGPFLPEIRSAEVFLPSGTNCPELSVSLIESRQLGIHAITGCRYENPDGSTFVLDRDYFGFVRTPNAVGVGPFAPGWPQRTSRRIWPVAETAGAH